MCARSRSKCCGRARRSSRATARAPTRSRPGIWASGVRGRRTCWSSRCATSGRGNGSCSTVGARCAADIGSSVVIVDRRPAYLTAERFPTAAALIESRPEELLQRLAPDAACYAVVMTHNFADDQGYLRALVGAPVPYIGMLGPRQRTERMLQILGAAAALGERDAARIYGPVGLDVGTDGAEQVALSVIAEILAVRSGRRADSLRERQTPIHAAPE